MKLSTALVTGLVVYYGARLFSTEPRKAKRRRTGGVLYKLEGKKNRVRYGQTSNIEKRAPISARNYEWCLGSDPKITIMRREPNRAKRLKLERRLIQRHRERAPAQVCNLVDW